MRSPNRHPLARAGWLCWLWVAASMLLATRAHASPFGVPARANVRDTAMPVPGALPGAVGIAVLRPPGVVPTPAEAPAPVAEEDPPPKLVRKRDAPPFWIHREFDTHTTRAVAFPPLFVDRKPKPGHPEKLLHADLSLTFGWYDQRRQKRRWINPAALFWGSFSPHKSVWGAVPLLMGYKRVGEQFNFGQFPLVWWWGNRHVKNFLVLPFHYQQRAPDGFKGVTGLVAWYGSKNLHDADPLNDRKHRIVFPVWLRLRRGFQQFDISPLYIGGRNEQKGSKWRSVLPLFLWESLEHGNRKELWTLPFIRRTDRARQKRAWALPPLLTFSNRTAERSLLSVTPLFWRGRNELKGSKSWVLGPLGGYRDPRQRNNWVAPLWWHFHDLHHRTSTSLLVPLVHVRRSPTMLRIDTPLASALHGRDGTRGFGIYPLASHVRWGGKGRKHQFLLAGVFWHFENPAGAGGKGSEHFGVGPLLWHARRGERRDFGLLPLLVFADREGTKSKQVITPLFWHMRDRDPAVDRRAVVAGPFYVDRRRGDVQVGLPPLFVARSGDEYRWAVVPPLLFGHFQDVGARESMNIHPLFATYRAPGRRTVGSLLFWDVQRPSERHSVLFPLYYRRQYGARVLTLTPVGGARREGKSLTWVAALAYGQRSPQRTGFGVLPLFFHQRRKAPGDEGRTTGLVPLFLSDRRPSGDLDVFTPLVWRSRVRGDKPRNGLAVVPFYFRQRQPKGVDVDAGIPFFWSRDRGRHTHTLIAGPFYHRLSRKALHTGVAPITWWTDSVEKRRLISLPIIFHQDEKKTGKRTTIAVPFWFDRRLANGRRTWAAFPFVIGRKGQYNFTRVSVAIPGFFDIFRLQKDYRFTGFVPLLFRYRKCGYRTDDEDGCDYTLWGSFPLFLAGRDRKGRVTHGALGLYYYDRDKGGRQLYTWLAGGNYRPNERLMWYALTLFHDTSRTHRATGFLPLFFHRKHRDEAKNQSTTLVLPPLYIGQKKGDRSWFQSGLLVWHVRRPHKVTTVVLPPLFGLQHAYAERRLSWVAPLYLRDSHWGKDRATTLLPPVLFVQHRRGSNNTAIQIPLLWHFERKGNLTTVGVPMWYDVRRGTNRTQVAPLLFARRSTADKVVNVIGPALAWWGKGRGVREGDRWWRALLGLFGGGTEGGQRYVALFGAKIRVGGKAKNERVIRAASRRQTRPRAKLRASAR